MDLLHRLEAEARERLGEAVYDHYAGGAGDERTLADNEAAWRRLWLRPRVLAPAEAPDLSVDVLRTRLAAPLLLAPVGSVGHAHPEGPAPAARAAAACGVGFCLSTRAALAAPDLAVLARDGAAWFQLYVERDRGRSAELLGGLREAGYRAVLLTVDLAVTGRRERDRRHLTPGLGLVTGGWDAALSWADVAWAREAAGLPVLVKGVLTAEDARLASEHGADGVVVSNHGGRQLEGAVPTAVALAEVAEAVGGRLPVLVDGGLRSGADVFRALALGARAVLVGRPWLWGLAARGEDGVRSVVDALVEDLRLTMTLAGCPDVGAIGPSHVRWAGW